MKLFVIFQLTIFCVIGETTTIPEIQKLEPVIKLKDLNGGHNVVGKEIQLECQTTFYAKYVSIEWKTPPKHEIYKNVNIEERTDSCYVTTSILVVPNAETRHSGLYICEIIHKQLNYSLAMRNMTIRVHGEEDHFIEIKSDVQKFYREGYAKFEFQIKAHPSISVNWIKNRREVIKNSTNITISLTPTSDSEDYNYKAKITFNYITPQIQGRYKIIVNNGIENSNYSFDISLPQTIFVKLSLINVNEAKMTAVYQCRAIGKSKPKVTWMFEPCDTLKCLDYNDDEGEGIILKELYHEDQGLQVVSYVAIDSSKIALLKCVTQDSEAVEKVFHTKNKFEYFVEEIGRKKLDAGFRQIVNIFCSRSLYKYSDNVFWYRNGKIIHRKKSPYFNIVTFTFSDKALDHLEFDFVVEDQLGNFTCQVLTRTGEIESQTVEVVSKNMTSFFPKISVLDLNGGQTTVGQDIRLVCNVTYYKPFWVNWWFYSEGNPRLMNNERSFQKRVNANFHISTSYLTISRANLRLNGYYECVTPNNKLFSSADGYVWVKINDVNETILSFEDKILFDVTNMKIKVLMTAHPSPTIKWFDHHGKEICHQQTKTSKFRLFLNQILERKKNDANYEATLAFDSIDTRDFGNYTIVAENEHTKISFSVQVNATGKPSGKIDIYNVSSNDVTLKCSSFAHPQPTIEWYFTKCTTLKSCLEPNFAGLKFRNEYLPLNELWIEKNGLQVTSYISVNLSKRGVLVCRSVNSFGQTFSYEPILGNTTGFEMYVENANHTRSSNKTIQVVGKQKLHVICGITIPEYTNEFAFLEFVGSLGKFVVPNDIGTQQNFLFSSFFKSTTYLESSGDVFYSCAVLRDGLLNSRTIHVESRLSAYVKITKTNLANSSVDVDVISKWTLYCYFEGFPTPNLTWYKNDQVIVNSEKFKVTSDGQVLEIDHVFAEDEGTYKCTVFNDYNEITNYISLSIVTSKTWFHVQIILLSCAVFIIAILTFMKFRKYREIRKKLKSFGLFYSQKNSLHRINPNLRIEDQTALLPFYRKWEIPFQNIIIGKQLGSGAFGVTFQATIVNHFPRDPLKTVAVKTVNPASGFECLKALVSELKILSHLGSHVNIVNFLGACTRRLIKDELYVVLEFCSLGSLLDYIKKHSENFIDYKNYDSDVFNWGADDENSDNTTSVSSKNFLVWAFQIARGMEYLGSRRLVHGDLAARNVLLTDENIVKICDFGLAKNVYNYGKYIKKSQGLLPIRWMAVETIQKGIFSTQSDVWSFGVVLWEIFSLGKTPYFGENVDEKFCEKLINGYRMEQPGTATSKIYKVMLACWQLNPVLRPSFTELGKQIGLFLDDAVRKYYISMNNGYILTNKEQFDEDSDYLAMVNQPTYQNLISKFSKIPEAADKNEIESTM